MFTRREMPRAMVADMLGRLAVALAAGIDMRRAWQMEMARVPAAWRPRMEQVGRALAEGNPLAEALAAAGGTFPPLVRGMAAVGDRTGHEAETLREVSEVLHRGVRTTRELRRSLAGPAFQLAVAIAVVGFLIFMAGMMSHDILRIGLRGTSGLITYLAIVAGAGAAAALLFGRAVANWRRHGVVRMVVDRLPMIGPASRGCEAAAWCRAASLASGAGLDARRLLELSASVAPGLAIDIDAVENSLRSGATLAEALDRTRRFPLRLLEVIAVGEATGNTAEVLDRLAGQFDDEARAGFEAAARVAGFLVWAAVAGLITLIVFRIFSSYLGAIQNAAGLVLSAKHGIVLCR
jgi:type II secretory pathway component PulF